MTTNLDTFLNSLTSDATLTDAEIYTILTDASGKIAEAASTLKAPLTHEQRGAMFATFTEVFGDSPKQARRVFTRLVLGKPADAPVSWAAHGTGTLTKREASRVLDALTALKAAL